MKDKRPDYPNCVMTPGVIRGVQERQRAWDRKHPKEAEAKELQNDKGDDSGKYEQEEGN